MAVALTGFAEAARDTGASPVPAGAPSPATGGTLPGLLSARQVNEYSGAFKKASEVLAPTAGGVNVVPQVSRAFASLNGNMSEVQRLTRELHGDGKQVPESYAEIIHELNEHVRETRIALDYLEKWQRAKTASGPTAEEQVGIDALKPRVVALIRTSLDAAYVVADKAVGLAYKAGVSKDLEEKIRVHAPADVKYPPDGAPVLDTSAVASIVEKLVVALDPSEPTAAIRQKLLACSNGQEFISTVSSNRTTLLPLVESLYGPRVGNYVTRMIGLSDERDRQVREKAAFIAAVENGVFGGVGTGDPDARIEALVGRIIDDKRSKALVITVPQTEYEAQVKSALPPAASVYLDRLIVAASKGTPLPEPVKFPPAGDFPIDVTAASAAKEKLNGELTQKSGDAKDQEPLEADRNLAAEISAASPEDLVRIIAKNREKLIPIAERVVDAGSADKIKEMIALLDAHSSEVALVGDIQNAVREKLDPGGKTKGFLDKLGSEQSLNYVAQFLADERRIALENTEKKKTLIQKADPRLNGVVYAELLRLVALKEAGSPLPKIAPFPPEEGIKIEPAIIKDFAIRAQAALGTSEPNARMRAALAGVTTQAQLVEAIALNMRDAFGIIDRFSPSAADPLRELATLRGQSQKRALFTERYEKFAEEMHLCRIPRDVDDAVARHSPGLIAVFDKNDPVAGRQVFDAHKLLVQDLIDDALALAAEVDKSRNQTGTQLSIPVLRETRNGITVELRETFDGCEFTLSYPNSIRGRRGLVSDIKREVKHKLAGLGALSPFKSDVATASISFHLRACDVNPGEVETRFHTLVAVLSDKRNIKDVLGEHGGIFGGKRSVLRMGNSFHLNQFLHGVGYEFDPLGSDSRERRVYFAGAQNMDLTGAVFGREVKFAPGMKFTRCFARAGGTKRGMFVSELIAADPKFHDSPLDISTEVNGLNSPSGDLPIIYLFSRGSADAKKPSGAA